MSDTYQGHGWWQASDGKWYPPEQHPDYRPAPPPPPTPPPAPSGAPSYPPPYAPPAPSGMPPLGSFTDLGPSGSVGLTDSLGRPLSGWWRRFFAFAIDSIIILVPKVVLSAIALPKYENTVFSSGRVYLDVMLLTLAWAVIDVVYFGYLNGSDSGQTVGQKWLGIAVRDEVNGGPIGFQRAALRILILNPSVLVAWIPVFGVLAEFYTLVAGLSPLWDQRKQGFHDKVEKTVVIKVR